MGRGGAGRDGTGGRDVTWWGGMEWYGRAARASQLAQLVRGTLRARLRSAADQFEVHVREKELLCGEMLFDLPPAPAAPCLAA